MDINKVFKSKPETRWVNKQRVLILCSKGITERAKQLMLDLYNLLPHAKKESTLEKGDWNEQIRELCILHSCRSFIFFESRKGRNLYIWIGRFPNGPTVKYFVEGLHNSEDAKLQGNVMKGSRPILSFDLSFNESDIMTLQKELFIHTFNVPKYHPKSMPCCDRVFSFLKEGEESNKIWFRQFEIKYDKAGKEVVKNELMEVGPRMILNPILILEGCMSGDVLYKNDNFVKPKEIQKKKVMEKKIATDKKKLKAEKLDRLKNKLVVEVDEIENIFDGPYVEKQQAPQIDFNTFKQTDKFV